MSLEVLFNLGKVTCWQLPASLPEKAGTRVIEIGRTTFFSESPSVRASSTTSQLTFCLNAQKIVLSIDGSSQIIAPLS